MLAWNGEDPFHCDEIVKEAMTTYWRKCKTAGNSEGHFIRRSDDIKPYLWSKAIDSRINKPPKLSVMVEK